MVSLTCLLEFLFGYGNLKMTVHSYGWCEELVQNGQHIWGVPGQIAGAGHFAFCAAPHLQACLQLNLAT